MLKIKQFQYKYTDNSTIDFNMGDDLCKKTGTITHLGIQAPQGTKFQINGSDMVVGPSEVFELDNVFDITSLIFKDKESSNRILVDVIYREGSL